MSADEARETAQERGHHLIVTKAEDYDPEYPHFDGQIVCLNPAKCGGWQECLSEHEVDGNSAADGPWECDLDAPWSERDEFTFHGAEHEWRYGWGWTVEFPGCVVAENDAVSDGAHDVGVEHGEGTFDVDDEWDDTYLTLILAGRVDGDA